MSDVTPAAADPIPRETRPLDPAWAERLRRLAEANAKAHRDRLRALTIESALREFEQLCREMHALFDGDDAPRSHPVGLVRLYRRS